MVVNLLNNKICIITGGSGFLGRNFCKTIIENEGMVINFDLKDSPNSFLKENYLFIKTDISNNQNVKNSVQTILRKFGTIDVLINNACLNPVVDEKNKINTNSFTNYSEKLFRKELDVSLLGAFLCSKYVMKHYIERRKGIFLNISSDLGVIAPNHEIYKTNNHISYKPISYSIIKSGMIGLTKYLATYSTNSNIRSNALASAGVENNHNKNFKKKISKHIPLGRMATIEDVTEPFLFLISDKSKFVNGHTLLVDGGRTIW